ncbi:hypothetical protein [Nannocystis punicea]|uniref:Cytochrome c domain-containing protein n=1 Tax=Nannocystis punicea TaxID=2995304 RepID=A0ABY7GSW6_9BACT|nr:hypothetical protein [Nannocystis poenicansa]WAS90019.1 hypothetical protein O0S08_27815 [Nannocystis poenicansa]
MNLGNLRFRAYHRAAALAVTGLLACDSPEPSTTATESSTAAPGSSTDESGGQTTSGASQDTTGTGAPTSGSSQDSTETGAPTSTTTDASTTDTGAAAPSFTEVYESIFMASGCLAGYCHGNMAGELLMTDEATAYANLVEVEASQAACGLSVRVVPGAPEQSVLWRRVRPIALDEGDMCATKMPSGSMGLGEADAQLVHDWIAGGALE